MIVMGRIFICAPSAVLQVIEIDTWFGLGYICQGPQKFSTLPLARLPEEDRADMLGVTPVLARIDGRDFLMGNKLWNAIKDWPLRAPLKVKWFKYVADPDRRVVSVRPWRQRVQAIDKTKEVDIWKGWETELADLRAEDARRRGPRPARAGAARRRRDEPAAIPIAEGGLDGGVARALEDGHALDDEKLGAESEDTSLHHGDPGMHDDAASDASAIESDSDTESTIEEDGPGDGEPWDLAGVDLVAAMEGGLEAGGVGGDAEAAADPVPEGAALVAVDVPSLMELLDPDKCEIKEARLCTASFGKHGCIKYYHKSRIFVAECPKPAHNPVVDGKAYKCHLTRQATASAVKGREGQGIPLGLMLAWLLDEFGEITRISHVHVVPPTTIWAIMSRYRTALMECDSPAVRALLAAERPLREGEALEPPEVS